ncbi:MAG: sulfotransferase [Candidatus Woesebacteria bacterium]
MTINNNTKKGNAKSNKVDFFLIGAPKCGTTSLHNYLRKHPEVYMPEFKDRPYFGDDTYPDLGEKEYKMMYEEAGKGKVVGETCVWYMYSDSALKEIKKYNPRAKIIIMVRNPIDLLYALHSEMIFGNIEGERDFVKALKKEKERKIFDKENNYDYKGRRFLYYSNFVKFKDRIEIWQRSFGERNVCIIIFEEFINNTSKSFKSVLGFLDLDDTHFVPNFVRHNPNKVMKNKLLQCMVTKPPELFRSLVHAYIPFKFRYWLVTKLIDINTNYVERPQLSIDIRNKISKKFKHEVTEMEKMLRKKIPEWDR